MSKRSTVASIPTTQKLSIEDFEQHQIKSIIESDYRKIKIVSSVTLPLVAHVAQLRNAGKRRRAHIRVQDRRRTMASDTRQ
ncbi:hypothetical protein OK016_21790 [Vibrio chagasii]|nr:hypothetical protein [Vibrio chagasii]